MTMELRDAILLAGEFCGPPGKNASSLAGIRLAPRAGDYPARVYATNLVSAIMLDVDGDLPNLVADAAGIQAAVKADPEAKVWIDGDIMVVGRYRFRPWAPVDQYPGFLTVPPPEFFQTIPDSSLIPKVTHALGRDPAQPELAHVSFRPGWCEASDGTRVAKVPLQVNRTVQIHGDVFVRWPGGPVEYGVNQGFATFRWPGQLRWGQVYQGHQVRPYPNLALIDDEADPTTSVVVPVPAFRQVVKRAAQASPFKVVSFRFRDGGVDVSGLNGQGTGFHGEVPALCRGSGVLAVNGVSLVAALDAADTPRVLLDHWGAPESPLRMKSGLYCEHIWPVVG